MGPDLSKQFSLDYLVSGSRATEIAPPTAPRGEFDATLELMSQPILRKLAAAPNASLRQFDLIDQLADVFGEIRPEALAEVINRLEAAGRVRVLERQRHGNHLIQLLSQAK